MTSGRLLFAILAAAILAACAEEPVKSSRSYGPPRALPGMAPSTGLQGFRGMSGWHSTDDNYGASTPPSFKGY
jgi:hypothetical protein